MGNPPGIVSHQPAGPGEDIVEQIMIPCGRTERICRRTLFHSVLVQAQVNEVLIREYGKNRLAHRNLLNLVSMCIVLKKESFSPLFMDNYNTKYIEMRPHYT